MILRPHRGRRFERRPERLHLSEVRVGVEEAGGASGRVPAVQAAGLGREGAGGGWKMNEIMVPREWFMFHYQRYWQHFEFYEKNDMVGVPEGAD